MDLFPTETSGDPLERQNRNISKKEFGQRLFRAMQAKGWNQSQLARYAGLQRDNVSTYMRGKSLPTPANLKKLSDILDVSAEELLPNHYEEKFAPARDEPASIKMKLTEVHGAPQYRWLWLDCRLPRALALEIVKMIDAVDPDATKWNVENSSRAVSNFASYG